MSIKSDRWIRRMCEQHGMIEPFEPGQIRQNAAGDKIVSYGTSSYGYDIRCAPEFKVFTNIHSTVVDPKNFDENSFVDINKEVCVIPPNSFALARKTALAASLDELLFTMIVLGDDRLIERTVVSQALAALPTMKPIQDSPT